MASRRDALKNITMMTALAAIHPISVSSLFANERKSDHDAKYWHKSGDNIVKCDLCPNSCTLSSGKTGICRGRQNKNGVLKTLGYGYPCAIHIDPIEKKPLNHFLPGSNAFSIAVAGCNLRCKNCQNYSISQVSPVDTDVPYISPEQLVSQAKSSGAESIAYTYSEPTVWIEYMYDTAKIARKAGLKNVLVSSGYINPTPLADLAGVIDGAHFDLKSFDDKIYKNLNSGRLAPVLDTIANARKLGVWVEIINLVIPQWTDNLTMIRSMCAWIRDNTGADTPLHFSRFFPLYQLSQLYPTPIDILLKAKKTALEEKLKYVYIGNVPEIDTNTYCPKCNSLLIERNGYNVKVKGMKGAQCTKCNTEIAGVWSLQ